VPVDMTHFIPRSMHADLAEFHRRGGLKCWQHPTLRHSLAYSVDPAKTPPELMKAIRKIEELEYRDGNFAGSTLSLEALGCLMANGPKAFYPTPRQCEAMQNISLEIPFDMYRQPYPAILVFIPEAARADAAARFPGVRIPFAVIVRHWEGICINIENAVGPHFEMVTCTVTRDGGRDSIEECLHRNATLSTVEHAAACWSERIALNSALLLTHFPHIAAPADPRAFGKTRALMRRADPAERERGRVLNMGQITAVRFAQDVDFWDTAEGHASGGPARPYTGEILPPHWRRGHWRREAGYAAVVAAGGEPRRIFIRPVLVNAHRFAGDLADTSVDYRGHDAARR
jgi:hypothetical protein